MPTVWNHAISSIRAGRETTLVAVVDHRGSVPGTTGAKMIVSADGLAGTVGGGIVENEIIDRASSFAGPAELIRYDHTPEESDSLCSGTQTLVIMALTEAHLGAVQAINEALGSDGVGTLRLTDSGLHFEPDQRSARSFAESGGSWTFVETLGNLDTLFLIGGGHVALALSRVMSTLPFRIVVLDDRQALPTMLDNVFAHELKVIDYTDVNPYVREGDLSYAVIMTHAHRNDQGVLEQLVRKPLAYLGMLGSPTKVARIYTNLEERGVPRELLERVHAPVGLSIGSHTPQEIAISVAAEILKVRNEKESS